MQLNKRAMIVVAAASLVLFAASAYGQGVGNLGSLPGMFPQNLSNGWAIGTYSVELDPTGPAWNKHLVDQNGGPIVAAPGTTYVLQESLLIGPNQGWTDWHEEILTPGWEWVAPVPAPPMFFANGLPAPGLTQVITPATPASGSQIDFYFNLLPVGTKVDIRKMLQYTGTSGVAFIGSIDIAEYPTPEPASICILAAGGLLALRRRRA